MKSFFHYFLTSLLFFGAIGSSFAQEDDANDGYGGHWFIGLSGGVAWQQSDPQTLLGGGWSLYLGKNIYYSPKAPLSLDLRMRYLGTLTYGQDFQATSIANNPVLNGQSGNLFDPDYSALGFVFHNHRTTFHDLSLEARINFENLRRNHNIWASLYGGVGIGWYRVAYDQIDERTAFGDEYTGLYSQIAGDSTLSEDQIVSQLLSGRDGDYETWMDGSLGGDYDAIFTPSVGFELGYWVTPRFAVGIGHRVNWTFRDDFDGVVSDRGAVGGASNNIHHYSNLFLHAIVSSTEEERVKPIPDPVRVDPPQVNITNPSTSTYTHTGNQMFNIQANIRNVEEVSNVIFIVNNQNVTNFSFNPATDAFNGLINLNPGANTIRIKGSNTAGSDQDAVTIIYQEEVINNNNPTPPIVNITQPSSNPFTTNSGSTTIRASIFNVPSRNNVTFTVNGQNMTNFSFSGTTFIASGINLQQGNNTIVVTGTNEDGTASDQTVIIYQPIRQQNPPTVNITQPAGSSFNSPTSSTIIRATITNVPSRNNVTFTVNGQTLTNFNFSGTTFIATGVNLQQGNNVVVITGTNQDGTASDQANIIYQPVRTPTPPTVNITQPSANPFNTTSSSTTIRATITNIPNRGGVNFTVNGQANNSFNFSGTSFIATGVNLQQGNNIVVITATNQDGTAADQTTIVYQPVRTPTPPTVNITVPSANPYNTASSSTTIQATITNVPNRGGVNFTVNGQTNNNFSFSGNSFVATGVNLQQGNNIVVISGTNQDGTASDQTTIIYQPVQNPNPPTVNITQPLADPYNTNNNNTTIRATITNVPNRSGVNFSINGQVITNFNFSGTSFIATNVPLQQGNNSVVITGTNADGTDSDQTMIIYTPVRTPTPPTVNISNPSANPLNTSTATATINATITNVSNSSGVTFTVNGQNISNFSFNGTNFSATGVNLQQGNNTIVVTGTNQDGTASDQTVIVYTPVRIPTPPTVNISNPSANPYQSPTQTTTINATITNVANSSGVSFTVNGQNISNFSLNGTNFTATGVNLQQGNNAVVITGTNQDGTASDQTVIVYKPMPGPAVNITQPSQDPTTVQVNQVTIRATVDNVASASNVSFTVNGQTNSNFTLNGNQFTANNVSLTQGNNTFVITGTNPQGTASDQTVVVYEPQPSPPTVTITQPSSDPYQSSMDKTTVRAKITNVPNKSGVSFIFNGQTTNNFSYDGSNLTATGLNLNQGNNTVKITASNQDGNASDQTVIIYKPMPGPAVNITQPAQNPATVQTDKVTIRATVDNVSSANNVTFTVNGQPNRNFTLNGNQFTAPNVSLNDGNNAFVITGTNPQGTASDQTVVIYNPPLQPPTVDITTPSSNPYNSPSASTTIRATIRHVDSKNNVVFALNGQYLTNFSFSGTNFTATNVPLRQGSNTITISAQNNAGTASDVTTINYNPAQAPQIYDMSANVQPQNAGGCVVRVTAGTRHVSSRNEITFKKNGQNYTGFSFNSNTGVVEAVFNVNSTNPSSITYEIKATTSGGTVTQSRTANVGNCGPRVSPPDVRNMTVTVSKQGSKCIASVRAQVLNVDNRSGVSFKVNGQSNSSFNFANNNFTASVDISNVSAPSLSFVITGTNSAGNDSESKTASTSNCVSPPTISNLKATKAANNRANVTATLGNIDNKNQVTFKVNGQVYSSFTLRGGRFSATNIPVRAGTANFSISVRNNAGNTQKSTSLSMGSNNINNNNTPTPNNGDKGRGSKNNEAPKTKEENKNSNPKGRGDANKEAPQNPKGRGGL